MAVNEPKRTKRGLMAEYESTMPKFNLAGARAEAGYQFRSGVAQGRAKQPAKQCFRAF